MPSASAFLEEVAPKQSAAQFLSDAVSPPPAAKPAAPLSSLPTPAPKQETKEDRYQRIAEEYVENQAAQQEYSQNEGLTTEIGKTIFGGLGNKPSVTDIGMASASAPFTLASDFLKRFIPEETRQELLKKGGAGGTGVALYDLTADLAPLFVGGGELMKAPKIAKAAGLIFAAGAAKNLPEATKMAWKMFNTPGATVGQKIEAASPAAVDATMAGFGLAGGVSELRRVPSLLPRSADAVVKAQAGRKAPTPKPVMSKAAAEPTAGVSPQPSDMPSRAPEVQNGMTQEKWNTLADWQKKNVLDMISARKAAEAEKGKPTTIEPKYVGEKPPPPITPMPMTTPPAKEEKPEEVTPPYEPVTPPAPTPKTQKEAEELTEVGVVQKARDISQGEGTPTEKFRQLVSLYDSMPSLKSRTSESKTKQQYSTPPPLAYLADLLANVRGGRKILEPTAGHGMLVIDSADDAGLLLNELDKDRASRLRSLWPKAEVTELDAIGEEHYASARSHQPDRVVANPPFGSRITATGESERFPIRGATTDKATTPSIDMAIAHSALDAMDENGKAALILGAKTGGVGASFGSDPSRAKAYQRPELLDLFNRYKIKDWFTVGGNLYEKMGAGWPVDVVVIEGKGKTLSQAEGGMIRPWVKPPEIFSTWQQLESKLPQGEPAVATKPGSVSRESGGRSGGILLPEGGGGRLRPGDFAPAPPRFVSESPIRPLPAEPERSQEPEPTGRIPQGDGRDEGSRPRPAKRPPEMVEQPAAEKQPGEKPVAGTSTPPVPTVRGDLGKLNTPYFPVSKNGNPGLVAPGNLAPAMQEALLNLERETGKPVDEYVAEKLGWTRSQLFDRLNASQIDSAALMVRNIERGSALITGDQMGVGKGRQVATAIAYARKRGLIPVFVTAKKSLYEDMAARDLPAVGQSDFNPFITDSEVDYLNAKGEHITSNSPKTEEMDAIQSSGQLTGNHHGVFTTYDQLKADKPKGWNETPKQKAVRIRAQKAKPDGPRLAMLRAIAPKSLFILDESHTAAGSASDLFYSLRDILPKAKGSFFASATFAKRPDNLGLYAGSTLMKKAISDPKQFLELMKRGGNSLQQALSSMLTQAGEFVRREQDWSGVKEFRFKKSSQNSQAQIEAADQYTSFLRDLMRLSELANAAGEEMANAENQVRAKEAQVDVSSVQFGSRLFNLSSQYLLALRADAIANEAIAELKAKRKPFIAVSSTMEGPISDLQARKLPLNFGGILQRQMQKMLEMTIKDPMVPGGERKVILQPEDLPDGGAFYQKLEEQINGTDFGQFPISPIDYIKNRIKQAGHSIGEITGRTSDFDEQTGRASHREKTQSNETLRGYNHGQLDALIVNKSGGTGLSAHTDPSFKDQRQRVMIVGQPAMDINDFMQMLGRVMRFGQTKPPAYTVLQTALAAEVRFMTMLRKKMSSLNANTSADTESEMTGREGFAEDIFNQVGDEVVARVLEANPDLARLAQIELPTAEDEGNEGFARDATGRFVLLRNEDAAKLWNEIAEQYEETIKALDETGENPLKANVEDLKAKTLSSKVLVEGTGTSPFDGPAMLEKVQVRLPQKPMTHAQATELANSNSNRIQNDIRTWTQKSFEMEKKRVETARQRGASEAEIDRIRRGFQVTRDHVNTAVSRVGETYGVDPSKGNDPKFHGVVTDLKLRGDAMSDFSSPSRHTLTVAVNTGRRIMRFPLSMTEVGGLLSDTTEDPAKTFDSNSESSGERQMITGNILRGYNEAVKVGGESRPRISIYSKDDGSVGIGVMLPQSIKDLGSTRVIQSPEELQTAIGKSALTAGKITISPGRMIRVPASADFKPVWGHPEFGDVLEGGNARQVGPSLIGTLKTDAAPKLFQILKQAELDVREKISEPEEGKGLDIISMGGRAPGDVGEIPQAALGQLAGSLRELAKAEGGSVKKAFDMGAQVARAKDSISSTVAALKAAGQYMAMRLEGKPTVTPLDRALGKRHLALSQSATNVRTWVKTATRAMPNKDLQTAISNWIDTGGDEAKLREAIGVTPYQYKSGYERALNLTPEQKTIAENLKTYFEDRLDDAQKAGILEDGIENYIHRMYERESPWKNGIIAELRSGIFTGKPSLAKQRVYQYDFEAEKEGLKPIKSFIKRVAAYDLALNKAIADRELVKDMMKIRMPDGRPMIATAGKGTPIIRDDVTESTLIRPDAKRIDETDAQRNRSDFKVYDHPALRRWKWMGLDSGGKPIYLQGDALIHPDAMPRIHALFDRSAVRAHPIGRLALGAGATVKQTMLDLSGFHLTQVTLHAMEHRTFGPIKEIDFTDADTRGLIKGGMVVGETTGAEHFSEGLTGSSLTKYIPVLGPKMHEITDWMFNSYIPRLKVATGLHALERNRGSYPKLKAEQVYRLTANEMNAAFGELNYDLLGRSKTAQDVCRLCFFSPDFTEARARFVGQAATKYGREQLAALALGATALYFTARLLNKQLDGQYHNDLKDAFSVVNNGRAYSLRTVQGDLIHALTDPRSFVFHRLNPIFGRGVMEMMFKRDEFGSSRSYPQIVEDLAKTAIPISVKGFFSGNEQKLWESFLNSAGLSERRESAMQDVYKLAQDWKDKNHIRGQPGEFIYDLDKDVFRDIRIAAEYNGDIRGAIKKTLSGGQVKAEQIRKHFNTPLSGLLRLNETTEHRFLSSLSHDNRALYEKAKQERRITSARVQAFLPAP